MLYTLAGLVVVCTPFILIVVHRNKLRSFLIIFTCLSSLHLSVALITQALHAFTYGVIFTVHVIVALCSIFLYLRGKAHLAGTSSKEQGEQFDLKRYLKRCISNWFLIGMTLLGLFLLYTIRFNYTGIVDTSIGVRQVTNSAYMYPLYSDEWIGSALVDYSIGKQSLPLVNPIDENKPFINFLLASHSLFGEVILVLDLNPLTQYVYLAILNGILVSLAVFLLLRLMLVSASISIISAVSVLLITNSGNLPSLWYILPYTVSLTFLLFGMVGYLAKSRIVQFTNLIISLLLYPPIVIFIVPFLVAISYGKKLDFEKAVFLFLRIVILFLISIGLVVFFGSYSFSLSEIYNRAISFVIRQSLDSGKVSFDIWNIVPIYILPFVCIGLYQCYKKRKRFVLFPAVLGLLFWVGYIYTTTIFLIEPSRVIVVTSVLLIIIGGLGMYDSYYFFIQKFELKSDRGTQASIKVIVFLFFVLWIFNLSKFGLWHKLAMTVRVDDTVQSLIPAPPINRYLHPDDLRLFAPYKGKRFISIPWKGLVIGVATKNYPLESKPSTLTNKTLRYQVFMNADCNLKQSLAKKYNIDLVYSSPFECPQGFKLLGISSEGFMLYQFVEHEE